MSSDNSFSIEFPADRDCIPFVQDFFRDFLKSFNYGKKFSDKVANESGDWLSSLIAEEKLLHALPSVSFNVKCSGLIVQVQIRTTDKKEFITAINAKEMEEA